VAEIVQSDIELLVELRNSLLQERLAVY